MPGSRRARSRFLFRSRPLVLGIALIIVATAAQARAGVSVAVRRDFPAGSGPAAVAVGFVNQDRLPDLLVADDRGFEVLLGTATRFSTPQTVRNQPAPSTITAADFDGNGTLDVAFASNIERGVHVQH